MDPVISGLWPPVATPFGLDDAVDSSQLVRHCNALLSDGAHGLAILGTTSEANSLTLAERHEAIDALIEGGVAPEKILPGTGACAVGDAAALVRHAAEAGCVGALLLPPFYYKGVSDEGLFRFVASVVDACAGNVPRIMLYHIPPIAVVGWSLDLIGRLTEAFPDVVVAMKDSSGDYEHTRSVISAFPDLAVFPGAEVYLLKALRDGAAGCISATANVNARNIRRLLDTWQSADADEQQEALTAVRKAIHPHGMIPALKALLARRYDDDTWLSVRPPLLPLDGTQRAALLADPVVARLLDAVDA